MLGELDRAETYARENLERIPDYGPSRAQLGQVAMARSDWERAERELAVAVAQRWFDDEPLRIEAWAALARLADQAADGAPPGSGRRAGGDDPEH